MDLAWTLKDEVMMRGRIYYGKLVKGRAMFVAPRLVPYFNAIWGVPKKREQGNFIAGSRSNFARSAQRMGNGKRGFAARSTH
jgi:hypothetical protein